MKLMQRAENVFAVILVIAFFLPWINIGGFLSFSGYEIVELSQGLNQFAALGNQSGSPDPSLYFFYLVYLIPIFAVLTVILNAYQKNSRVAAIVAGVVPFLFLVYGFTQGGSDIIQGMAIGSWLTLLAATALLLAVFGVIKLPADKQEGSGVKAN
ncbi:hypothetical protein ABMA57_08370 [Saccharospirillum sp. HFRX-1]|uniref:hypothetical protein n=1 Tax=unclassified Saccharospirillum TaxID=2633430 RepID=UPI003711C0EC